jgi:hypothetical protein
VLGPSGSRARPHLSERDFVAQCGKCGARRLRDDRGSFRGPSGLDRTGSGFIGQVGALLRLGAGSSPRDSSLRDSRGSSRVCADFVRRSFTRSGPPLVTGSITGISRRPEGVGMPARHAAEEPLQPELEAIATGRGPVARENGRSRERPATSAAEPPLTRLARQSPLASSSQRSRTLSATGSSAPRPAGTGRATARETRG